MNLLEVGMAYIVEAEPGENVLLDVEFRASQKDIVYRASQRPPDLRMAISDRAFYFAATRFVVSGDPTYFRRVPKDQVREVRVQSLRPYGLWVAAALMVAAGLVTEILMMWPLVTQIPGTYRVSGWPLAILVGGLVLPFASKSRQRLMIQMVKGRFKWEPPLVLDRASKQRIAATLDDILKACQAGGYQVVDDRSPADPQAYRTA
jgi:hypothetical protein